MNKELVKYIAEMVSVDQGARKLMFKSHELPNGLMNYLVYAIDGIHNSRIREIIKEHGYPSKKLLGKKGLRDFWLLIQHQDFDKKLQKDCLENCDFEPSECALLTDRVLLGEGKKQIYGTQFYRNKKGELSPSPIKDKKNLEKLRREVGLSSFKEYEEKMKGMSKKTEKGKLKK